MHFAAQGVIAGAYDVVIAAGVEVMTRTPMGASVVQGMGFPFPQEQLDRYAETGLPPQGIGAEMIADEYGITRDDLDAFGAQSQQRAAIARDEGRFDNEIIPIPVDLDGERELSPPTRASARAPPPRRSPSSSRRSRRTARSPPATRRRSPTARRPC